MFGFVGLLVRQNKTFKEKKINRWINNENTCELQPYFLILEHLVVHYSDVETVWKSF